MKNKHSALWTLVAAAASMLPCAAFASNFQLTEMSVTSLGRAHSGGAAAAEDASTIWFNPAGLSDLKDSEILGGYSLIRFGADFTKTSATDATGQPLSGGEGGSVGKLGGPFFVYYSTPINDNWSFGIGLNSPFGLATKYDDDSIFRYQADYSSVSVINLNPTLSYKINDRWSLGFGVDIQRMDVKLTNAIDFGAVCFGSVNPVTCTALGLTPQSHDGFFEGSANDTGTGFNFGVLWNVNDDTRIGLSYRSRIKHTLDGSATFSNVPAALSTQAQFQNQGISADFTTPQIVSLSFLHRLDDKWSLTGDWSYTGWSSFDKLDIQFANPGTKDAVVNEGLSNVSRYSLGLDYKYSDAWTFRGGVALDKSPVPDPSYNPALPASAQTNDVVASRTARLPDADRKWLAFGASWRTSDHSQWDIGYAHLFINGHIPFDQVNAAGQDHIVGQFNADADILGISYLYRF